MLDTKEIERSLETSDPKTSRARLLALLLEVDRQFIAIREIGSPIDLATARSKLANAVVAGLQQTLRRAPLLRYRMIEVQYDLEPGFDLWLRLEAEP